MGGKKIREYETKGSFGMAVDLVRGSTMALWRRREIMDFHFSYE